MNAHIRIMIAVIIALAAVAAGTITYIVLVGTSGTGRHFLSNFYNEESLKKFLEDSAQDISSGWNDERLSFGAPSELAPQRSVEGTPHSSTNVQVAGIDEEDIVKTDGEYIYISDWDGVSILRAYPPSELANVSHIEAKDAIGPGLEDVDVWIKGLFLESDMLVVISGVSDRYYPVWDYEGNLLQDSIDVIWEGPRTIVSVFDVSDAENPTFVFSYGVSGYPLTSRMVDGRVYLVAQSYTWIYQGDVTIPKFWVGPESNEFRLSKIYYDPETTEASSFLNLLAVDLETQDSNHLSIVAGYASTVYMSYEALYLTIQKWSGGWVTLGTERAPEDEYSAQTTIYKVSIDGLSMDTTARGEVKGWLLNQFSMDEKAPYLRLATTTSWIQPKNNVYVLDGNLDAVGKLEDLAPTERIYAARFVGDVLYLVTFRQIDPLFVIDLSQPMMPKVVGELEMPGFSSYLHPVDEDHVLGIGYEDSSLKVALYDVSDPANPIEESKYVVSDSSWSLATYDHKAVLFDLEKELLVIPGSSWSWSEAYESSYKAGAFVFRVSLTDGVSLRGIVEQGTSMGWWYDSVQRSLYIGDYLYTVSSYSVKASSLDDLSEIGFVWYNAQPWSGSIIVYDGQRIGV